MEFLVYMVTYVIAYPLVYFILKTIEHFYGTQIALIAGLLLIGIVFIALWRLIVNL